MVWPKFTVSDYREMLRKLSSSAFLVTVACVWLLRSKIAVINQLLGSFDLVSDFKLLGSISIPFGTVLVAGVVGFLSESVKLHDKISDLLHIRAIFDVHWILIPMALVSGATVDRARFERIKTDRKRLMGEVFYRYASSGKNTEIDSHLVIQALTAWSWYWVFVESLTIIIPTAAIFGYFGHWKAATLILMLSLLLQSLMRVFRSDANRYAQAEVSEILSDGSRLLAVKALFDAL
jgi:hypothetical protein